MVKVVVQFGFMEEEAGFSCFRSAKPSFVTDTAVNHCIFFPLLRQRANPFDCSSFNLV